MSKQYMNTLFMQRQHFNIHFPPHSNVTKQYFLFLPQSYLLQVPLI